MGTIRCTVCETPGATPDPFYYVWRGRRFDICRCRHCTHQFVHPPVTREDQDLIYADTYFSADGDWVCGMFGGNSYSDAEASLRAEAREILAMLPQPPGKLLDVGCAGGVFLDEARSAGFEVLGVEPNASMARSARTKYSLNILNSRIEDLPNSWGAEVNVITLLDCLEHIPEPLAAIQKLRGRLVPGGHLFIRGPLANTALSRIKEGLRRLVRIEKKLSGYPLDANVFNKRSLTALCQNNGFAKLDWKGEAPGFANLLATAVSAPRGHNNKANVHGNAR